jgi:hypothetical protein
MDILGGLAAVFVGIIGLLVTWMHKILGWPNVPIAAVAAQQDRQTGKLNELQRDVAALLVRIKSIDKRLEKIESINTSGRVLSRASG